MADKKISALTSASTPLAGTEVLPIVQSSATVKVAVDNLTVKNIRSNATTGILQIAGPTAAATRVMTTPDANFTAARTDAAQTFTGLQTFGSADVTPGPLGMKNASSIRLWNSINSNYSAISNPSDGDMRLATGAGDTLLLDVSTNVNVVSGNVVFNTAGKGLAFSSNGNVIWRCGAGTPEGAVTAPVGSLYTRTDGGASTTLYVKESGAGNTGWVAK